MAEALDWNERLEALEARLWDSADTLRSNSKLTSNQYCMPVMGVIFLRYAWGRFKWATERLGGERVLPNGRRLPIEKEDYRALGVLWLPEAARYDRLAALPEGESLAEELNAAMAAIEAETPALAGVLPKQYGELPPNILFGLVRNFNNAVLDTIGGDVFGRIYEYFLQKFAPAASADDGVFFTPKCLVKLIVEVVEPHGGVIFDPACGSGGMFIQSGDFIRTVAGTDNPNLTATFYGQEKVEYNAKLCRMNMAVHGLEAHIASGDEANSFYHDHFNLEGTCDTVMANPPFNVDAVRAESTVAAGRLPFGLPKVNKENGATVPLYYEPRGKALRVEHDEALNRRIAEAIDEAAPEEEQREKLERLFRKAYYVLTAEERLRAIAEDMAAHFAARWRCGKAMMVCLDKLTCVRLGNGRGGEQGAGRGNRLRQAWAGHPLPPRADGAGAAGQAVQGSRRPVAAGLRLRHVADGL